MIGLMRFEVSSDLIYSNDYFGYQKSLQSLKFADGEARRSI